MAALLAQGGYTAAPDAFEHPQGFFAVFNGAGHYDAEKALAGWGTPLEIAADTVALKRFPCCGSAQPAIVLALELVRDERIQADEIAGVMIRVPRPGLRHTDRPDPATALDAKFSVQYAVARALASGDVRLEHFAGEAHREAAVRRVMAVTRAVPHPDMDRRGARHWGAEVAVTLKDGRTFARTIDRATEGADALSDQERRAKFLMCAERALPAAQAAGLWDVLANLRSVDNVRAVTALVETPGPKK
jgi:2-methylcitrate dehydratase PrpD